MRTIIYVDGFNFHYNCVKGTSYRWLNLKKLFENLLGSQYEIIGIKYFTAEVKNNYQKWELQKNYFDALQASIPEITFHYGDYVERRYRLKLAEPPKDAKPPHKKLAVKDNKVAVMKKEEKCSDVNLATNMLNDAWLDKYDCAVLVSNDLDLAESMRLIRQYHPRKMLGLINPSFVSERKTLKILDENAHFTRRIRRKNLLIKCQLPEKIPNTSLQKPEKWK